MKKNTDAYDLGRDSGARGPATFSGVPTSKLQHINMAMPTGLRSTRKAPLMARNLGKKHRKTKKLRVPSVTMGVGLYVESNLERTTLLALDIDPRVNHISSQPVTIRLDIPRAFPTQSEAKKAYPPVNTVGSKDSLIYTPDFCAGCHLPSQLLIEVKYQADLSGMATDIERLRRIIPRVGYRFVVVTDVHVGHKDLHLNLIDIRDAVKHLRDCGAKAEREALLNAIGSRQGKFSYDSLIPRLPTNLIAIGLACGIIGCDLRAGKLRGRTMVWPAYGDLSHLQLLDLDACND